MSIRQLEVLRDKCYLYQILTTKANIFYSNIKQFINIPLIVSSFALSILNSNTSSHELQLCNVIINCVNGFMISLINNFRIVEKQASFKNLSVKFMNLLHEIEDHIANDEDITADECRLITKQYDEIISNMEFQIPDRICKKIRDNYRGKRHLPVILIDSTDDERKSPLSTSSNSAVITVDVIGQQL